MQDLYKIVKEHLFFNKFVLNDLICIEYTCPVEDEHLGIYAESDYLIHVLSGKKTWRTIHGVWVVEAGQTLYVKKGASIISQSFDDDFCMLGFFLPDDLIRTSLQESMKDIRIDNSVHVHDFTATKLVTEPYMDGFFQSMLAYFREDKQPSDSLLKLKLKELLVNIVFHCKNPLLISYLNSITANTEPSLPHIMETNFCYNLKLDEFAQMSHRSLSTFKRDFFNHYNTTPGKWLMNKRLDFAAGKLLSGGASISEVAFDSGFEDLSHFSRSFKKKFGNSPSNYLKNSKL